MRRLRAALAATGLALLSGAALAQTDAPPRAVPPTATPSNPNAAPPDQIAPPLGTPGAPQDSGGSGSEPLGDRLSRSRGTVAPPPNVDPGMAAHPPDTGPRSMPVLPPPGTPGGDPTVVPK